MTLEAIAVELETVLIDKQCLFDHRRGHPDRADAEAVLEESAGRLAESIAAYLADETPSVATTVAIAKLLVRDITEGR
jgi:hypothetical protein